MSEDTADDKVPSELRTVTENVAVMGLVMSLALVSGENFGTAGEIFAGALVVTSGILLKAKSDLEIYQRSVGSPESNREFMEKVAQAVRSLRRRADIERPVHGDAQVTVSSGDWN